MTRPKGRRNASLGLLREALIQHVHATQPTHTHTRTHTRLRGGPLNLSDYRCDRVNRADAMVNASSMRAADGTSQGAGQKNRTCVPASQGMSTIQIRPMAKPSMRWFRLSMPPVAAAPRR